MKDEADLLELSYETKPHVLTKRERLIKIISSLLHNSVYKDHLTNLMLKLNLNENLIIKSFLDYNLNLTVRSNDVYTNLSNRFVLHAHNLIEGSWHQQKQICITNAIEMHNFKKIIDVGFGVPTQYIKKILKDRRDCHVTLCDFDEVAFNFAERLLSEWNDKWEENVSFNNSDMNQMEYLGDYDAYLFQDCIEHTFKPTDYLIKQVQHSPNHAKFIFILVIGPLIPMHYIAWENLDIAKAWLKKCNLKIDYYETIKVNPAVDLFAEGIPFGFSYFCCSKL